jgi:hypothetical protein
MKFWVRDIFDVDDIDYFDDTGEFDGGTAGDEDEDCGVNWRGRPQ